MWYLNVKCDEKFLLSASFQTSVKSQDLVLQTLGKENYAHKLHVKLNNEILNWFIKHQKLIISNPLYISSIKSCSLRSALYIM